MNKEQDQRAMNNERLGIVLDILQNPKKAGYQPFSNPPEGEVLDLEYVGSVSLFANPEDEATRLLTIKPKTYLADMPTDEDSWYLALLASLPEQTIVQDQADAWHDAQTYRNLAQENRPYAIMSFCGYKNERGEDRNLFVIFHRPEFQTATALYFMTKAIEQHMAQKRARSAMEN